MIEANEDYETYLRSPHWRSLAARIKEERKVCEHCSVDYPLEVHHLTYDRLGRELDEDLVLLCRTCHQERHDNERIVNWAYARSLDAHEIMKFVPDFEEGVEYTERQLGYLADKLLLSNPDNERPVILDDRMRVRKMREIYVGSGVPDPSIEEGLYWRTHPRGRAWWNYEERQSDVHKHGFYRNASAERMIPRNHPYVPEPFKPLVEDGRPKTFVMGGYETRRRERRNARRRANGGA